MNTDLTELRDLIDYDPSTGIFIWKEGPIRRGKRAGSLQPHGYRRIHVGYVRIWEHRLAWAFVHGAYPDGLIDHINGDRSDNRIENLRQATAETNAANSKTRSDNTSGYKGVSWNRRAQKWQVFIGGSGGRVYLGLFSNPKAAHEAYLMAAKKRFGEFARGA